MFNRSVTPYRSSVRERRERSKIPKEQVEENSLRFSFRKPSRKKKGWACSRKKRREEELRPWDFLGREEAKERMDKRWTSFTHRRPTYLANESQGWRHKGLVAVCRDKLDSSWQFEFILELGFAFVILPSIFEDVPFHISFPQNFLIPFPISNLIQWSFVICNSRDENLNNSFLIVNWDVKLDGNQNWCRVMLKEFEFEGLKGLGKEKGGRRGKE